MNKNKISKNNTLLENAKSLRRNMTPQEKRLWYDFLQHYPIKVYKQRIIDNYIVDFYCHKAKLAIELDGYSHYTVDGKAADKNRTNELLRYNIYVLRFSNSEIENDFDRVCNAIKDIITQRLGKV